MLKSAMLSPSPAILFVVTLYNTSNEYSKNEKVDRNDLNDDKRTLEHEEDSLSEHMTTRH